MNRITTIIIMFIAVALARSASAHAQVADLTWNTIDCGGGTSATGLAIGGNDMFELNGTIAQPDAGVLSGGPYTLSGGFWPGPDPNGVSCEGDADGTGAVDVDDLIAVILGWGACPACPPSHCASDVAPFPNGNCATDVDDLISVILHWGACN
jgi:hypothetical protein